MPSAVDFSRRFLAVSVVVFTSGLFLQQAEAANQDKKKSQAKITYIDPEMADEDFAWQGEFMGLVRDTPTALTGKTYGLQLIARGSGYFEAALYTGGLPGDGWNRQSEVTRISSGRDGDDLRLETESLKFQVHPLYIDVFDVQGGVLGRLLKYARQSPTLGKQPPHNATVLFNGTSTDKFKNAKTTEEQLLVEGTETVDSYADFHLHLEFRLPYKPYAISQQRGNSGLYLQSRYEVQILDSFGEEPVANGCGGVYKLKPADLNMCLPPLTWQTYDVDFVSAKFDDEGQKIKPMTLTVKHNGVKIHDKYEVPSKTGAGKQEGPEALPTKLQDHQNPVRYRNIWLVDLKSKPGQTQQLPVSPSELMEIIPCPCQELTPYWSPVEISPSAGCESGCQTGTCR